MGASSRCRRGTLRLQHADADHRSHDAMRLDELLSIVPLWLVRSSVFVFGLLWGSFLNVVIYRVPREMSVVRPASHCPGCGKPVEAYDNVPVLSYVILRGRARCCGARMSPRYPLVELIGGALSLAILEVIVLRLPGSVSVGRAAAIYGADFALCLGLVAAAFIDAEHMFLPDSITIGGTIVGVFTASLRELGTVASIVGALSGFLGVFVPFIFLYKGLLGRTGMGLGDAKLLALAGAWFGWPGALFTLLAGAVQGTVYAGVTRLFGIEPTLPAAVLEDIAELERAAAEGDEEAKRALAEDPLTEDEDDAFIVRFFRRLFGASEPERDAATAAAATSAGGAEGTTSPGVKTGDEGKTADDGKTAGDDKTAGDEETRADRERDVDQESDADERAAPRARIPFGPFLILAILELLFAGEWLKEKLVPFLWPVF